jgi:hypothetical protein
MAGVTFADGEQVSGMASSSQESRSIGSSGGPVETPTDEKGRSSDVSVGNNENMPPMGGKLDSPCDY